MKKDQCNQSSRKKLEIKFFSTIEVNLTIISDKSRSAENENRNYTYK